MRIVTCVTDMRREKRAPALNAPSLPCSRHRFLTHACAQVLVGSCEFQIGPVEGLAAADELWMARYILARLAEEVGAEAVVRGCTSIGHDAMMG